ncbi:MAG: AEC family transporter, partial [Clostridia bacterium]|nr:AEC family transporter [Clostridia bacterium]
MEIALDLIYQVAILFLMMLPGVIMRKAKLCCEHFAKGLSGLVLYIAQPCLIFLAYLRPYDRAVFLNCLWVLLLAFVAHAIFAAAAFLFYRNAPDGQKRILRLATVFGNAAFMGVPMVGVLLGPEALLYASVYNIVFNLFLWSLGVLICTHNKDMDGDGDHDKDDRAAIKRDILLMTRRTLLHPVTLAAALGLVFFFLPIENTFPALLTDAATMLSNLVAPLAMMVIGLRLSDMRFKGFFRDGNALLCIALRHILLPLAVLGLIKLLGLVGAPLSETVSKVVLILAATPVATSASMFAERYDCDACYAGKIVTVS